MEFFHRRPLCAPTNPSPGCRVTRCTPLSCGFVMNAWDPGRATRRRAAIIVGGGPLASLVAAAGALLVIRSLRGSAFLLSGAAGGLVSVALLTIGLIGGVIVLTSIVRFGRPVGGDDGAQLRRLARPGTGAALVARLAAADRIRRSRPRDWPGLVMTGSAEVPTATSGPEALYYYYPTLDFGDIEGAANLLAHATHRIADIRPPMRSQVWLEVAYFAATHSGDVAAAHEAMATASRIGISLPTARARAAAAVLLAEGQTEEASAVIHAALRRIDRDPTAEAWDRAWLPGLLHLSSPVSVAGR